MTTIQISKELQKELKLLKIKYDFSTYESLFKALIKNTSRLQEILGAKKC
jgi:hypothetical protein